PFGTKSFIHDSHATPPTAANPLDVANSNTIHQTKAVDEPPRTTRGRVRIPNHSARATQVVQRHELLRWPVRSMKYEPTIWATFPRVGSAARMPIWTCVAPRARPKPVRKTPVVSVCRVVDKPASASESRSVRRQVSDSKVCTDPFRGPT